MRVELDTGWMEGDLFVGHAGGTWVWKVLQVCRITKRVWAVCTVDQSERFFYFDQIEPAPVVVP